MKIEDIRFNGNDEILRGMWETAKDDVCKNSCESGSYKCQKGVSKYKLVRPV